MLQLITILNRCHHIQGFVYQRACFSTDHKTIEITVRPRKGTRAVCSRCQQPAPGYDQLAERRFEFIPFWVANAAKRSNISLFVYSSVASADQRTGIPYVDIEFRIEETFRGTGMRYTIIRPVFFMENWLGMRQAIEGGAFSLPLDPATRLQ